ncbi:MAG: hypothetical protein ACTHM5_11385 [Ginsengibacter sp.]
MKTRKETNSELIKYAGMGMQFLAGIGLGVFFGFKADGWLHLSFPLLVWLLPLLIIISMTIKIIRDTSNKR